MGLQDAITHSDGITLGFPVELAQGLAAWLESDPEQQVVAKPLEWDQDSGFQWTDKHHGFSIIEEPGDDLPFSAAWGEGDADQFATLDQAKAWCQAQIDAYFGKHAAIATTKATT